MSTLASRPQAPKLSFELCIGQKAEPSVTDKQRKAFTEERKRRKMEDKKQQNSRKTYKD